MIKACGGTVRCLVSTMQALRVDRRGVTALEYGVIAAVVIVVGLATVSTIGDQLATVFTNIGTTLTSAAGG